MAVPGVGYECLEAWLQPPGTVVQHVRQFGYDAAWLKVDALSSSANNARQIRDALMAMPAEPTPRASSCSAIRKARPTFWRRWSRTRRSATASRRWSAWPARSAARRSRTARSSTEAEMLQHFPGATCTAGDGGAVDSLKPTTRKAWLAQNPLPRGLRYYSLAAFPQPERISSILKSSYNKLARIDARNDSQLIFYDQIVPGSVLMGYLNADHWAVALPINRVHTTIASIAVTENAYPREALLEALLRFVEEDLAMTR